MTQFTLKITALARDDLDAIGEFIQQDNPARAESLVEELARRIEIIAERPLSFPRRDEIHQGVRSAVYGNHLILFRVLKRNVIILRVTHGARDLSRLLGEGK